MTDQTRKTQTPKPVVLCILDGWGERDEEKDNAIAQAPTPTWDHLLRDWPHAHLNASAGEVGLPEGQMGNSEVGHMNIGAGRVVEQELVRIDKTIAEDGLKDNGRLKDFITTLKESGGRAHLMGLLSPGGVHAMQDHMVALAKILHHEGIEVLVHAFLDGRDTPPKSALEFVEKFETDVGGAAKIVTVSGRYYAMDRDKRWERIEKAYLALAEAQGETAGDSKNAIENSYDNGASDEFVLPTVIGDYDGMRDGDGLLMANFRADRAREILTALGDPDFDGFARPRQIAFAAKLGMVKYSDDLEPLFQALFPPAALKNILGEVIAKSGLSQLRIAETEKYAHVTFFLNGGEEKVFEGEERILIPSPKVATYDLKPEMSAIEVTDRLVDAIGNDRFDVIIVNYANGDMVGHTGDFDAALKAAETIDKCLGRLEKAVVDAGGTMLITADHGNIEMMTDEATKQPHTAHTLNPVPVILVNPPAEMEKLELRDGRLSDIAPTLLELLGLKKPEDMTGKSLIAEKGVQRAAE